MNNLVKNLVNNYVDIFKEEPKSFVTAGGRLEIIGNHTDHNHGLCIVGNCSLRIKAVVNTNNTTIVKVKSKGHSYFEFDSSDLAVKESEYHSTKGLVRGILAKIKELCFNVGGFNAYIESDIPEGSGVSSSAAFEILIGEIVNYLFNDSKISHIELAKVGQFSENVYFNKPCGLLDQIGAAFKDCNFIDFKEIANPKIDTLDFNLPVEIYLINSEGDHKGLSHLYAAIPDGMRKVANLLGEDFLRETKEEDFTKLIEENKVNDQLAENKARHFYNENKNVLKAKKAIEENDYKAFFEAIKSSQDSSNKNLENTFVKGEYEESPQHIIDTVNSLDGFDNYGAIRIHGGGFKGSVLCFVLKDHKVEFENFLESRYHGRYTNVSISKEGTTKENI